MNKHKISPKKSLRIGKNKDKINKAQRKIVFEAFKRKPSTMLMVSIETGILRANICRYVAVWEKQGKIHLLKRELCKISKHHAGYYTTDTKLFTQTLNLFLLKQKLCKISKHPAGYYTTDTKLFTQTLKLF